MFVLQKKLAKWKSRKAFSSKSTVFTILSIKLTFTKWKNIHQIVIDSTSLVVLKIPMMNYFPGRYHVQVPDSERKFNFIQRENNNSVCGLRKCRSWNNVAVSLFKLHNFNICYVRLWLNVGSNLDKFKYSTSKTFFLW